ncbi:S8 family serine peptidase [Candidatus Hecatella orcuttiae]|jgi:subtilisin family serine protease|uniref:S8 family serine peptidase n=1 Tax=Candidatus Hecatella orcuttiae TaxID=1935119 RepID=UPI002867CAC6|nr:S8 family serine peptidase [Candidatus Hecatella orcuttiae]
MNGKILSSILMVTMLMLAGLLVVGTGVAAKTNPAEKIQVIVVFKDRPDPAFIRQHGGNIKYTYDVIPGIAALLPQKAVDALEKNPKIAYVERDIVVGRPPWAGGGEKEQPPETLEWGVDRIDADLVWDTDGDLVADEGANMGSGIKVAVLDTGIDKDHPDLQENIKGGVNFVSKPWWKDPDPNKWDDDNGHGTYVAGIIAAVENEIGVIGSAPKAWLYGVKVLDRTGSGYVSDVIAGIDWSVDNGMHVISMSLGSSSDSQALHDACDNAYAAGLVLVAAAGNSGDGDGSTNEVLYPAKYSSVIAVAATDKDDSTPTWSSEGEEVELAAPGVDVRSTWKDGSYETHSGTSAATPHVSGTIALVLYQTELLTAYDSNGDGALQPSELRTLLRDTADDLGSSGFDNFYGYGLVDAEESVTGTQTNP